MCEKEQIPIFIRRRISMDDLNKLVDNVKSLPYTDGSRDYMTSVYDLIREFIFSNEIIAKEIRNKSDLYLEWYSYYFEIQDNILLYINKK